MSGTLRAGLRRLQILYVARLGRTFWSGLIAGQVLDQRGGEPPIELRRQFRLLAYHVVQTFLGQQHADAARHDAQGGLTAIEEVASDELAGVKGRNLLGSLQGLAPDAEAAF